MAKGFFLGLIGGVPKFMDPAGKVVEIPANRVPRGLRPGQDFEYRASKSGNFRIAAPTSARGRASNSATDRQQYAMKRLMSKGWTAPQAAGVVGRFMQESYPDLRTTAVGDRKIPGGSYGIMQVNRDRKTALFRFAKNAGKAPSDFDVQLDFFDWEIRNSPHERLAYAALRRAKTPEMASEAMMHYERPAGYKPRTPRAGHAFRKTVRNAKSVMSTYDPDYQPKVDLAASEQDVARAHDVMEATTGDASTAEYMSQVIQEEDPTLAESLGLSTGEDTLTGEEDVTSETPSEEPTFGDTLSTAAESYGQGSGSQDRSSDNYAFIQAMIEQGVQSSAGSLPRLPSMDELFREG